MNIFLWVLQVLLVLFFMSGAVQQLFNFEKIAKMYVIYRKLPRAFWTAYGAVTILCCAGMVLTRFHPLITPISASILTAQGLLFAWIYAKYAGIKANPGAWAAWTLTPCAFTAFIAYARFVLVP